MFALKSKKANKTNSSVCFLGESIVRQSAFWNYLTFSSNIARTLFHSYIHLFDLTLTIVKPAEKKIRTQNSLIVITLFNSGAYEFNATSKHTKNKLTKDLNRGGCTFSTINWAKDFQVQCVWCFSVTWFYFNGA